MTELTTENITEFFKQEDRIRAVLDGDMTAIARLSSLAEAAGPAATDTRESGCLFSNGIPVAFN